MSKPTRSTPPTESPDSPPENRPDLNADALIGGFVGVWEHFTSINEKTEFNDRDKTLASAFFGAGVEFFQKRYNTYSEEKWRSVLDAQPQTPYLLLDIDTRQVSIGIKLINGRWAVPMKNMHPTHYALLPDLPDNLKRQIQSGIIAPVQEESRIIAP